MSDIPFSIERSNLLGTEAFRNLLGESLKKAKKSVIIFTAYIKVIGIEWLEQQLKDKNINCTIVSRWQKSDLAQGSSDLDCYLFCKKNNWTFKILSDLHAKLMVIDDNELFIGSPNLTGKGMSLVPVANKEMGIKTLATEADKKIIKNLTDEAITIDDEIYNSIKQWQESLKIIKQPKYPDFPQLVKDRIKESYDKIWVHNFPWSAVDQLLNIKEINSDLQHDLELFGLSKDEINEHSLTENLKNSKVYKWLINQLNKEENKEIYFGKLSEIIHNSLLDDPRPYRKEVKELQENLYSLLKRLKLKEILIDQPNVSDRVRLLK